jgi:hypothetical protein
VAGTRAGTGIALNRNSKTFMNNAQLLVQEDCRSLLERALLEKTVCAFGEDGFGKYGSSAFGAWYTIIAIEVAIYLHSEMGQVTFFLEGYDSRVTGHAMTDKNLEISLIQHLKAAGIDPDCFFWQHNTDQQGIDSVTMDLQLDLLLGWK